MAPQLEDPRGAGSVRARCLPGRSEPGPAEVVESLTIRAGGTSLDRRGGGSRKAKPPLLQGGQERTPRVPRCLWQPDSGAGAARGAADSLRFSERCVGFFHLLPRTCVTTGTSGEHVAAKGRHRPLGNPAQGWLSHTIRTSHPAGDPPHPAQPAEHMLV